MEAAAGGALAAAAGGAVEAAAGAAAVEAAAGGAVEAAAGAALGCAALAGTLSTATGFGFAPGIRKHPRVGSLNSHYIYNLQHKIIHNLSPVVIK